MRSSPAAQWAEMAVRMYDRWQADRMVVEVNQGGDMVEHTVRTAALGWPNARSVRRATFRFARCGLRYGKHTRAEPISALMSRGVHHVGMLAELMIRCGTKPGETPDRMDALVWALTELMTVDQAVEYAPSIWG